MLDAAYPEGALNYWKSNFLAELSDSAIDAMIEAFARCPTPMGQLLLEHFHGAATRVGVGDTAFPLRKNGYNFLVLAEWMETADSDRCIAWARQSYDAMNCFFSSGRYVNYLSDDERQDDPVAAAYGPNYRRRPRGLLRSLRSSSDSPLEGDCVDALRRSRTFLASDCHAGCKVCVRPVRAANDRWP